MWHKTISDLENLTALEERVIFLMRNAESMNEEHAPYRYIRQRVRSNGIEFYFYQGGLDDNSETHLKDLDGALIGRVRSVLYWELVREIKDQKDSQAKQTFFGKSGV